MKTAVWSVLLGFEEFCGHRGGHMLKKPQCTDQEPQAENSKSSRIPIESPVEPSVTISSTLPHAFGVDEVVHIPALPVAGFDCIGWQHNPGTAGSIFLECAAELA
jgi:hypothetical protein